MSRLPIELTVFCFTDLPGLRSQTSDAAVIYGPHVGQSHTRIAGVEVMVTNELTGFERTAQAVAWGNFLPSGALATALTYAIPDLKCPA